MITGSSRNKNGNIHLQNGNHFSLSTFSLYLQRLNSGVKRKMKFKHESDGDVQVVVIKIRSFVGMNKDSNIFLLQSLLLENNEYSSSDYGRARCLRVSVFCYTNVLTVLCAFIPLRFVHITAIHNRSISRHDLFTMKIAVCYVVFDFSKITDNYSQKQTTIVQN